MASDKKKGSGARLAVLGVVVVALVAVFAATKLAGPKVSLRDAVLTGELLGKSVDDATRFFGVQPEVVPNEETDSPSTRNFRYTVTRGGETHRIRVREQAGKITATKLVDEQDRALDITVDAP